MMIRMAGLAGTLAVLALANVVIACAAGRITPSQANGSDPPATPASESAVPTATPSPTLAAPPPAPAVPGSASPPTSGPAGWELAWSDGFDGPAGTPPDPAHWGYDLGDGTGTSVPGWGNNELEYYTNDVANAAMDGNGNLVIFARDDAGKHTCYYGACRYTSARLLSKGRYELAFGRVEARIKVPTGSGMWPAFWMLGANIDAVGWPDSGEIDVMEVVGRLPRRLFGTIHGPGYSGDRGFGKTLDLDAPVADDFHTFAIEWSPGHITWSVDGVVYHEATPAEVAPHAWAFDHPFFLLLNVAVGGNFGGPVGPETTFPQAMTVDHVRVYRAAGS